MTNFIPILYEESYMSAGTHFMHSLVLDVASFSMYVLELLSIAIIVVTTLIAFWKMMKKEPYARIYLLHGQSIGLTFKLGAEILRTVTAASIQDIIEVFLLIVIKACIVALIERELRSTEAEISHGDGADREPAHEQHSGKFNFSLFNKETKIDAASSEINALQKEVTDLRKQIDDLKPSRS